MIYYKSIMKLIKKLICFNITSRFIIKGLLVIINVRSNFY